MKIYIAGKVRGAKWKLVDILKHKHPHHEYYSSDIHINDNNHGLEWKWHGFNDDELRRLIIEQVFTHIDDSQLLIAYLDEPTAYGSIAEIAYAAGRGIDCRIVIERKAEYEGEDGYAYEDAYQLLSYLPNVDCLIASNPMEAARYLRFCLAVESPIESRLVDAIGAYGETVGLEPQFPIGKYRVDLAYPLEKIAIECDGHDFHSSKEQRGRDAERDRFLIKEGWRVLRFTGTQIHKNPSGCAQEIREVLRVVRGNITAGSNRPHAHLY